MTSMISKLNIMNNSSVINIMDCLYRFQMIAYLSMISESVYKGSVCMSVFGRHVSILVSLQWTSSISSSAKNRLRKKLSAQRWRLLAAVSNKSCHLDI